ncbi:MAG: UDP-glucose 4-epimerase GalE [Jatrophihabitans sp.]|uniref:UDP-glucose 4-epimerase GalE n=1 Tax=Jatrophihabitans sp. TaxID=1932789 RepID=UPI003F7E5763
MRILVTGGAGYIGSVVTAQLLDEGHDVTVLDDLSTGHADAVPDGARFVQGGIDDAAGVLDGVDAVVHFAAKSLVGESTQHPDLYWRNNVVGTLALLDAMRAAGVPRIVFSSSAATYGDLDESPISEQAPNRPSSPYGATKLAVDLLLSDYAACFGMAAVSLRYFNVAGAMTGGGRLIGERHPVETHLIPNALRAAAGDGPALSLFGTDYPTPDGTCVRDYIHVVDLGEAHLRALAAAEPSRHLVLNLGSGTGYSVRQVIDTVGAVTGRSVPVVEAPRRAGDPAELVAGNQRAGEVLGWRPTRDLHAMVADAWTFHQRLG